MSDLRARLAQLARRGAVSGDQTVDVVELVNWVYAQQKAHLVDGRGVGLFDAERAVAGMRHGLRSSLAGFEHMLALGVRVDQAGHDAGELHPVAEAVNNLVMQMPAGRAIIVLFARRAAIPDGATFQAKLGPAWKLDPRYDLVLDENQQLRPQPKQGSFKVALDGNRQPFLCFLEFDHEPEYERGLRAEYLAWHDALSALAAVCRTHANRLGGLHVTGPALPREPWHAHSSESPD